MLNSSKISHAKNGRRISSSSIGILLHCFQSRHTLISKIGIHGMSDNSFPYSEKLRKIVHYACRVLAIY